MKLINKKVGDLKPYKNNPRNNDKAVGKVAESIKLYGFIAPIIIDQEDVIIAGHTRWKAAMEIGIEAVPCLVAEIDDPELVKQYRIIDNKTQELSTWDMTKLIPELRGISEIDMSAFEFADFDEADEIDDEAGEEDWTGNLDEGEEINLADFDDEVFNHQCPQCGFRWNE